MIDAKRLLDDLKLVVTRLEDDLRERADQVPEMAERLRSEYRSAQAAGRTGESFEAWREAILTQAAVAWILACAFVRFMEDNGLIDEPLISGPGEQRSRASDRQTLYFQSHPTETDRDYLYDVFRTVARLPAVAKLYDEAHNPIWSEGLSGDAARDLIAFWRQVVPETGDLVHDFTDAEWNTRFLGDLYQDLSEAARKRFALLQTPEFVEAFILDRTLEPAIAAFGLKDVRLMDPTCGSGHFLLGAFRRLLDRWFRQEPGTSERALVQRALDGTYGVDINPYAVAIARFRLIVAALKASGIRRMKEAPGYRVNVTAGDSLLHGPRLLTAADSLSRHRGRAAELDLGSGAEQLRALPGIGHAFEAEDLEELNRILGQRYHAVVGNPPYITVKDKALNQLYRDRFDTCHRKYALAVPFTERFFQLAIEGAGAGGGGAERAGYVGMITANSFMKREFGKKLVEEFFPGLDLTHVIDTSGAYIPGHGTPTVILFGRDRAPVASTVRTVMGIKGEPSTPEDAAHGKVWQAIVAQVDQAGSESEWVSVGDTPRESFGKHPWSIGGGGAAELREAVEEFAATKLGDSIISIGFMAITGEDEAFILAPSELIRHDIRYRLFVEGDVIRDWAENPSQQVFFPYATSDKCVDVVSLNHFPSYQHRAWSLRTTLRNRKMFGKLPEESGLCWHELRFLAQERVLSSFLITFAFVATHNHFVLDRGGKVFNRSAPVIKLPADATEADHLALLGLLNSSTACFWMKQILHNKGGGGIGGGLASEEWEQFYEFTGTGLQKFPLPDARPTDLATELDRLALERQAHLPAQLTDKLPLSRAELDAHKHQAASLLRRMIALQEELDWRCYTLYGLTDQALCHATPPEITLGERAFEIAMARQIATGVLKTTWFDRHRSKPITDIPQHWPGDYRQLVERRITLIESDRDIGLIERPEYKRRWNQEPWEALEQRALRAWLLDCLEQERYWPEPRLQSARSLAARAETDADFMAVAALYVGQPGFDAFHLVAELVVNESVPLLPVLRYKPSGLRKRQVWEQTWELQRSEDAIDQQVMAELTKLSDESDEAYQTRLQAEQRQRKQAALGDIPSPPKYRSTDFMTNSAWKLRGPLDVPKERLVSYPHGSRENDDSLLVGWAGWDSLQQAQALAGYYTEMVEQEGWPTERLTPLLAGIGELVPWLQQWHNDIDPTFNERMGDFFETFLHSEMQKHGLTREDLSAWKPPATRARQGRRRA